MAFANWERRTIMEYNQERPTVWLVEVSSGDLIVFGELYSCLVARFYQQCLCQGEIRNWNVLSEPGLLDWKPKKEKGPVKDLQLGTKQTCSMQPLSRAWVVCAMSPHCPLWWRHVTVDDALWGRLTSSISDIIASQLEAKRKFTKGNEASCLPSPVAGGEHFRIWPGTPFLPCHWML